MQIMAAEGPESNNVALVGIAAMSSNQVGLFQSKY